jgi:hypothetical protein
MSVAKQLIEDRETLRGIAIDVLCGVGAIDECEFHDGTYFDGNGDLEAAYKLVNAKISDGEFKLPSGMTCRDLMDAIKNAYEDLSLAESCWACDEAIG